MVPVKMLTQQALAPVKMHAVSSPSGSHSRLQVNA